MSDVPLRILLVEDNPGDARLLREILDEAAGVPLDLVHVDRLEAAFRRLKSEEFQVLLLDLSLPDSQGTDTVSAVHSRWPNLPIVVFTGADDETLGVEAVQQGAQDYMVKGKVDGRLVMRAVRYARERKKTEVELRQARDELEDRVQQRTAELERMLNILQDEVIRRSRAEEALRESEELFRQLAQVLPEVLWIATVSWDRILYINSAYEKVFGLSCESLYREPMSWTSAIAPEDRPHAIEMIDHWKADLAGPRIRAVSMEFRTRGKGREARTLRFRGFPIVDEAGNLRRIGGLVEDVTERRQSEVIRRRLAAIVESSGDAILSMSSDATIITWNAGAQQLLGYTAEEIVGRPFRLLMPPDRQGRMEEVLEQAKERVVDSFETSHLRKDGQEIRVQLTACPIREVTGQLAGISVVIRDVTERNMLERRLLEIGEAERRRIGRDLHDTLGQTLTGAAFLSKVLEKKLLAKDSPDAPEAVRITEVINQSVAQSRALARGLRPVELQADGLMTALGEIVQDVEKTFGIKCQLQINSPILLHDSEAANHLYNIAREAVNNAVKHAKPKSIQISMTTHDGNLRLAVMDDGAGFVEKPAPGKGMGLQIMRYRSRMIGATLDVQSEPQGGTAIICTLPLPKQQGSS